MVAFANVFEVTHASRKRLGDGKISHKPQHGKPAPDSHAVPSMTRAPMTSNIVIQIGNGPVEESRERCHIPLRVVVGHGDAGVACDVGSGVVRHV